MDTKSRTPLFGDDELAFIIKALIPDCEDVSRMVRALRDDDEILEGMLNDQRLFKLLMDNTDSIQRVSPLLFFTLLLNKVKMDLKQETFTIETAFRHQTVVFDIAEVFELISENRVRNYMAEMLVSFVRINSYSIPIRIRKGVWRKFRFSDFDINSLIRYSRMIDRGMRYETYKRIADICLFTTGIFPNNIPIRPFTTHGPFKGSSQNNRQDYTDYGRYFYRAAAEHEKAQIQDLGEVLRSLSDNFTLATKPLNVMVSRYLGNLKDDLFLQ
jgi:hypothetical protein